MVSRPNDNAVIGTRTTKCIQDKDGIVTRDNAKLDATNYHQESIYDRKRE